jgi:hypothetical protein
MRGRESTEAQGTVHLARRPSLSDAMILVAATAAALGCLRQPLEPRLTCYADGRIIDNLRPLTLVGAAFTATWGAAVLAIRLRRPRPCGTDWRRRPGFIACVAATAGCLAKLAALLIWGASVNYLYVRWYVPTILGQMIEPAAMAVVGAWLALWLARMWKREQTWVDDLGIAVGLSWIALDAFAWASLCFR